MTEATTPPLAEQKTKIPLPESKLNPAQEKVRQGMNAQLAKVAESGLAPDSNPGPAIDKLASEEPPTRKDVVDPATGKKVETISKEDFDKSKEQVTKERAKNILDNELRKSQQKTNDEFKSKYPDAVLGADGTPEDPAQLAEYVGMDKVNSEKAHSEALRATVTQEYMDRNPKPDKDKDPVGFDKWSAGLREELDTSDKLKDEMANLDKETEDEPEGSDEAKDKDNEKTKDKDSDSFLNALRLAYRSLSSENKEEDKIVQEEIDRIDMKFPKSKPKFRTKVTIAKTLIIAGTVGITVSTQMAK